MDATLEDHTAPSTFPFCCFDAAVQESQANTAQAGAMRPSPYSPFALCPNQTTPYFNIFDSDESSQVSRGSHSRVKHLSHSPRYSGLIVVMGPCRGFSKELLAMQHISCNVGVNDVFHFVTWGDDASGEFCVWYYSALAEASMCVAHFYVCWPRLLTPYVDDISWLKEQETPKHTIIHCNFSNEAGKSKLLLIVDRRNYPKPSDNGIGMMMVRLPSPSLALLDSSFSVLSFCSTCNNSSPPLSSSTNSSATTSFICSRCKYGAFELKKQQKQEDSGCKIGVWYQIGDESMSIDDVLCVRWTRVLMLGRSLACGALVRKKGMFEMVKYRYGSSFQNLYDEFCHNASSFCQYGRYHRFWVSHSGELHVMLVHHPDYHPCFHPEWNALFDLPREDLLEMRVLGRRIGYFINNLMEDKDPEKDPLRQLYLASKKGKRGKGPGPSAVPSSTRLFSSGRTLMLYGLHLYRCWQCKRCLLRPLLCANCQTVCYCGQTCQAKHWPEHKTFCETVLQLHSSAK